MCRGTSEEAAAEGDLQERLVSEAAMCRDLLEVRRDFKSLCRPRPLIYEQSIGEKLQQIGVHNVVCTSWFDDTGSSIYVDAL